MPTFTSVAAQISADIEVCLVPVGASEPVIAGTGILSDQLTNFTTINNGGQPVVYSTLENGDIRTESSGTVVLDFNNPVTVEITQITDPALANPDTWTHQSGGGVFPDRIVTNGGVPVFSVGAIDPVLEINSDVPSTGEFEITAVPTSPGVGATDDWGVIVLPETTQITLRFRNNSAINIRVIPLEEKDFCSGISDNALSIFELLEKETVITCPPTGVTSVSDTLLNTGIPIGQPGTIIGTGAAVVLSGAIGVPVETDIQFRALDGNIVDAVIEVTKLGAGGQLSLAATGVISNGPGAGDYNVKVTLTDGLVYRWGMTGNSTGGSEALTFNASNPVTEYTRGAGGIALTLPYVGSWNNNNNNASSAFGFDASNTLEFRTNGQNSVSSGMTVFLRDVPTLPEQEVCDRTEDLLAIIEEIDTQVTVSGDTGLFRIGDRDLQLTAIASGPGSTSIITGHDLTQGEEMTLKVKFRDTGNAHSWTQVDIDVDDLLARFGAGSTQDASGVLFDNDFVVANVVDAATGEIAFSANGRAFSYLWSELWIAAPKEDPGPLFGLGLEGPIDADQLTADLPVGLPFHFQTGLSDAVLTSANIFGSSINGDLLFTASTTITIPAGTQGFLTKNASGGITVAYTTTN